jgi:hypothetical protein
LASAVVFIRGEPVDQSRPWDLPAVTVEQRGQQCHVVQGAVDSPYGFVHRGDGIDMVSRDPMLHALHAGGADFFTLMFPDANRATRRQLDRPGLIELTSGVGLYWMRAYLFVEETPYITRTNETGYFTITGVPPGRYDVICWHPNWRKDHHQRDPELGLVWRYYFKPPAEIVQAVTVRTGDTAGVRFRLSMADFERPPTNVPAAPAAPK